MLQNPLKNIIKMVNIIENLITQTIPKVCILCTFLPIKEVGSIISQPILLELWIQNIQSGLNETPLSSHE